MEGEKNNNREFFWYVGYGSNLCRKRFIPYIQGDKFWFGGRNVQGCSDKTFLDESKPFKIPYSLYFANKSGGWDNGGAAFISLEREPNEKNHTYGRMWKVTEDQFDEIWEEEGNNPRWYNKKLTLGHDANEIPIVTITTRDKIIINKPSEKYLQTMAKGLWETYHMDDNKIVKYLIEKPGIKGNLREDKLFEIINSNNNPLMKECRRHLQK